MQSCTASLGTTLVIGLHDPVGTMGVRSQTFLLFSSDPDPAFPCGGTPLPGLGLSGPGAPGEVLVDVTPPNPLAVFTGPPWTGTPVSIPVEIPSQAAFLGSTYYGQGVLVDPSGRVGVTAGVELLLGL